MHWKDKPDIFVPIDKTPQNSEIFGHDLTDPKESHKESQAALAGRVKSSIGEAGGVRWTGSPARN